LPVPRYDLLDRRRLGFWLPVQASRGCPRVCRFCSVAAFFAGSQRYAPVEHVVRDVRAAKARGVRHIALIDDNVAGDPDRAARLFEALIPERIVWMSQATLDLAADERLLGLASRSGCRVLSFGIESTSDESLAWAGKGFNHPSRYGEAIARVRAHGIEVSTEMMVGLDGDDATVFDRTVDFLMGHRISVPRIHIVTPVPGTPLWADLERQGRILTRDLHAFTGGKVVFRPRRLEPEALQAGFWSMYERLFTWRAIAHRVRANPSRLGPLLLAFVAGVNLHYRAHVRRRICPGIV
ncbi:MAG TPA: radical SAM protein, partial [Anaeromyxobacteraceae bacterium]|nr:radical SAM protein [Anaeromyxobacteraceae bacterium]